MTVAAEQAVCAWVNQVTGLPGTLDEPGPLAQGAFTIEQRSPVGAGAYALILRQQGPFSGWSPRPATSTAPRSCSATSTTEVARATDRPNLDGKNPLTPQTGLQ